MTRMNYGPRFCNGTGRGGYQHRRPKLTKLNINNLQIQIQEQAQLVRDLRDAGKTEEMLQAIKKLNRLHKGENNNNN